MQECTCNPTEFPFWCERHRVYKTKHWVELCQTRPRYFQIWEEGRGPGQRGKGKNVLTKREQREFGKKPLLLGDMVEKALSSVGITKERVSAWIGRPCKCPERQEKLNRLHLWAKSLLSGKLSKPEEELDKIIGDEK